MIARARANIWWLAGGLALLAFYLWTASSSGSLFDFGEDRSDYYNLLSDGFLDGRLSLPVEPAKELLALQNPYDPAQNGPYRLHDASLYDGKYYLYFGPAPALLLWIPFRLLPFGDMPEALGVALMAFVGTCFAIALLRELTRRFLPSTPGWMVGAGAIAIATAGAMPFTLRRVAVYEVAITAGYLLLFAALWLLATGVLRERLSQRRLAAGSLLLGLAVAARPTMVVPCVLLAVLVVALGRDPRAPSRARLVAVLLGPVAAVGVLLAAYNAARFGSLLEFGQIYQLAGVEVDQKDSYNPAYLGPGLWYYLLARPHLSLGFPYVFAPPGPQSYPGELPAGYDGIEPTIGLLVAAPIVLLLAGAWWALRAQRALRAIVISFAVAGLAIMALVSFTLWGVTMRYEVDFAGLLLIGALLTWFALAPRAGRVLPVAGVAAIAWGAFVGVGVSFTGYYDGLRSAKPGTFEALESVSSPVPTAIAVLKGKTSIVGVTPRPGTDLDDGPGVGRFGIDLPVTGATITILSHTSHRVLLEADIIGSGELTVRSPDTGREVKVPVRNVRDTVELALKRGFNHIELLSPKPGVGLREVQLRELRE